MGSIPIRTVDLPVHRMGAHAVMKRRQVIRNVRRHGRTTEAALRLAQYRLRKSLREQGRVRVDDVTASIDYHSDGHWRVFVTTRCLDRLELDAHDIAPNFRVPPDLERVRIVLEGEPTLTDKLGDVFWWGLPVGFGLWLMWPLIEPMVGPARFFSALLYYVLWNWFPG